MVTDHQNHNGVLRPVTKYLISQALRGRKILSMLYHSSAKLREEQLSGKSSLSLGELVSCYGSYDLAVLYGLYLIYRRAATALNLDRETLNTLLPNLRFEAELGCIIGKAIPTIGIGNGALAGILHHLALAVIAVENPQGVKNYYAQMNQSGQRWNVYKETELFGCSSLQLGAVLLTKVGFNKNVVEQYLGALDPELKLGDKLGNTLEPIKFARLWIEGIANKQEQPLQAMPGKYYPTSDARLWIEQELENLSFDSISWIERSGQDVSPELTPLLFGDEKNAKDVPQQLRDIFTLKEIIKMSEEEFDELVDKIDISIKEGTFEEFFSDKLSGA